MSVYVRLKDAKDDRLMLLGYHIVHEDENTVIYYHLSDEFVVDKEDPHIMLHDENDAPYLGNESVRMPPRL